MLPVLPPKTLILGRRWMLRPRPGKVAVVLHDNREIVKRIERVEAEGLYITGDHPEASTDSRQYGLVPVENLEAIVFWPRTKKVVPGPR